MPTMEDVDALLQQGLTIYAAAKRLGIAESSLRLRLRTGRRYMTCRECGERIPVRIGDKRLQFCSKKCSDKYFSRKYHRRDNPKKEFDCANCGVHVTPDFGDQRRKFCCDKCRYEYNNEIARKKIVKQRTVRKEFDCKFCGVHVVPEYGDKRRSFCSRECNKRYAYTRFERYNATKKKDVQEDFTPTTFYCKMCGETAVTTPENPTPFFCCDLCREWYSKYLNAKNKRLIYERFEKAKKENCDNDKRDND